MSVAGPVITPEPVDIGNVHVGDVATQALTLANNATNDGFSENLNASFGTSTGDATAMGSISGLGAGASDDSSLVVGIDSTSVTVQGNVYQVAVASVDTTPVDFGIVHVGYLVALQNIEVSNTAPAVALNDVLQGGFNSVTSPFSGSGDLGSGVTAGDADNRKSREWGVLDPDNTRAAGVVVFCRNH